MPAVARMMEWAVPDGGMIHINSALMVISAADVPAAADYRLQLYRAALTAIPADNAPAVCPADEQDKLIGFISFNPSAGTPLLEAGNCIALYGTFGSAQGPYQNAVQVPAGVKKIFGVLQVTTTPTPRASTVYRIDLAMETLRGAW